MDYIYVGKFLGTHGLKGEIKFQTNFKYIDRVLKNDFAIFVGNTKEEKKIVSVRPHQDCYLILMDGVSDIDLAKAYVNEDVYVERSSLNLSSSEYVVEDFLDKKVYFGNDYLGVITGITDYGSSNYVMEIVGDKEILVPYNDHFIEKVDEEIYLKNLEGIIDEDWYSYFVS